MEVGHEGTEHVIDRGEEQDEGLGHTHARGVHAELGPLRVVAEHEVVRPEQQLGQDRGRRSRRPVPDEVADLPRLGGERRERRRVPLPHEPCGRGGQEPRARVREHAHPDGLGHDPPQDHQRDPRQRLPRPIDRQGVPHDLQPPGRAQVDLAERDERDGDAGRHEGGSTALPEAEGAGQRRRRDHHEESGCDAHRGGDRGRGGDHRPDPARLPLADVDGHPAHGGHVHAEPGGRARDEGELGGQRDRAEDGGAGGAEGPRDQDVRAEGGDHEDRQAGNVLAGPGQDRAAISPAVGSGPTHRPQVPGHSGAV